MKRVYVMCTVALISIFASCMGNKKDENQTLPVIVEAPLETEKVECYQAIIEKDTITLSIDINSINELTGDLNYSYYQKDKSFGTILGNVKGDTIFADYTFESEGKTSVRELAFLKSNANTLLEGFGEVIESNGKTVFKDKSKLRFDGNVVYNKIPCSK